MAESQIKIPCMKINRLISRGCPKYLHYLHVVGFLGDKLHPHWSKEKIKLWYHEQTEPFLVSPGLNSLC